MSCIYNNKKNISNLEFAKWEEDSNQKQRLNLQKGI